VPYHVIRPIPLTDIRSPKLKPKIKTKKKQNRETSERTHAIITERYFARIIGKYVGLFGRLQLICRFRENSLSKP